MISSSIFASRMDKLGIQHIKKNELIYEHIGWGNDISFNVTILKRNIIKYCCWDLDKIKIDFVAYNQEINYIQGKPVY